MKKVTFVPVVSELERKLSQSALLYSATPYAQFSPYNPEPTDDNPPSPGYGDPPIFFLGPLPIGPAGPA